MYQTQTQTQTQPKPSSSEAKEAARKTGKPFCKVCFDAGKPASEYTSHYLKSYDKLVCPTLLNQACLNCGQRGHTSSYCNRNCNRNHQRTQPPPPPPTQSMMQPTITLTHTQTQPIGVEAELRLMTATFKSKHGDFPLLKEPNQESNQESNQEPNQEPNHVYNPKSNAFGALSQKHPNQSNQSNQSHQSNQSNQSNQKSFQPQTMAERLKNPERLKKAVTTVAPTTPTTTTPTTTTFKVKFADLPPKSQFWWQDLDD